MVEKANSTLLKLKEEGLDFCGDKNFRTKIIEIINGIFPDNKVEYPTYKQIKNPSYYYPKSISERYTDMIENIDEKVHTTKEAYIKGDLKSDDNLKFDYQLLNLDNEILAGLDLPVWISNCLLSDGTLGKDEIIKIMFVSQDPRRNFEEMGPHHNCISLSSPFGWHDIEWRSKGNVGLIPKLCYQFLIRFKDKVCFYFTDFYKLRRFDLNLYAKPKSSDKNYDEKNYKYIEQTSELNKNKVKNTKLDQNNKEAYKILLQREIDNFKPNFIICIGTEVGNVVVEDITSKNNSIVIPHPSGRNRQRWNDKEYEEKIKEIISNCKNNK